MFATREQEAAFWETHDTTDFADEFTDVGVRFAKNLSQPLSIRLDPETLEEPRQQAHEKGIGPTTLARMRILERLRSEQRP
jgi:hypothetical protein